MAWCGERVNRSGIRGDNSRAARVFAPGQRLQANSLPKSASYYARVKATMGRTWVAAAVLLAGVAAPTVLAQSPPLIQVQREVAKVSSPMGLPDAPLPADAEPVAESSPVERTSEVLASDPYRPLTAHQKWDHFLHRTYSSATFLGVAEGTVFSRATGGFMYCCGIGSWGEQYASGLADTESRQFFGNFLFPTLLKQDPRYFPKRKGSAMGRGWYAATRVLVTRNDSGREMFNYSEVLGVAFTKALSNAYYPERDRGGMNTTLNILGTIQSDATSNLIREFWPDITKMVHKHTPERLRKWEERLPLPDTTSQY
jgi:hypothetical protein